MDQQGDQGQEPTGRDFRLEQYRQAHEADRHYDAMAWAMGTVFLSVAVGILGFAASEVGQMKWWVTLILGFVSVAALCVWKIMFDRMNRWQQLRTRPLIEAHEEHAGAEAFFRDHSAPETAKGVARRVPTRYYRDQAQCLVQPDRHGIGVRKAITCIVVVFAIAWILLTALPPLIDACSRCGPR
jgi:hypothetical protein